MKQTVTLLFLTLLLFCSCKRDKGITSGWTDTLPVEVLVVDAGTASTERNYVGDIGSEREVTLTFMLGGTLTHVAVHNGQRVAEGQLLAEVDATTARSMHAAAQATLRQAEDAYRRLEAVHREGGISDVRWVEMETDLEKARQTELSARKRLEGCSIRAPFAGVVACQDHHVGQELKPGESFGRLIDMGRLRVNFSVPEQEISLIQMGDVAEATVPALDNRHIDLRIADKGFIANPLGHTYRVHAAIVAGDLRGILPDMVAKVHARLGTLGGIVVPSDCVQVMPNGTMVWVVQDGRAQHRTVTVGDFVRNNVYIKAGLAAGDTVITAGQQKLYTGAKVKATVAN